MKKLLVIYLFFISFYGNSQNKKSLEFKLLEISNKNSNDFSPSIYKNGILFVSDRNSTFYNLYFYDFKSNPTKIKIANQKYHIGQAFYDSKKKIIYITKSSDEISKNNTINLAIYQGKIKNNKIRKLEKLEFCNPEFSYGYAQIFKNELLISTEENGYYILNLYTKENNKWKFKKVIFKDSSPILNPIFKNESTILFASKRKGGIGGMDIYKLTKKKDKWSTPINLKEFNTKFDELSILFLNEKEGFISSNRIDNKDHIFKFKIN